MTTGEEDASDESIEENMANQESEELYNVNLFRIKTSTDKAKPQLKSTKNDFTVEVIIWVV